MERAQRTGERLRVAVTGGSGKVGREAIRALRQAGHRPSNFDVRASSDGGHTAMVDFSDFGQAVAALSGVDMVGGGFDAVLHLAGLPGPGVAPDHEVFRVNVLSTYNIFSACARLGIPRIVWASSVTLYGFPLLQPPDFLPIDESHPTRAEWSYSLAKRLGEEAADAFARWSPSPSIVSLQLANVLQVGDYEALGAVHAHPATRRRNLWSYVDARDAGEACRLAIEAAPPGHQAMIVAAADTLMPTPTAELLASHFAGTPVRGALEGRQSLLSTRRAEQVIGYRARYSWREPLARGAANSAPA